MQTKLTLRLDEQLIEQAKRYAHQHHQSVSQIVALYFALLSPRKKSKVVADTPIVASLRGILRNANISEKDYREHLEKKYL